MLKVCAIKRQFLYNGKGVLSEDWEAVVLDLKV